jgi:large subunit ribosomal protein L22
MEAIAKAKYLRCSARKVRQVADLVKGMNIDSANAILFPLKKSKKSARLLDKVLKSAVANLKEKNTSTSIDVDSIIVRSIQVDGGPQIKRIRARAQGRAFRIIKKQCHVTIAVSN